MTYPVRKFRSIILIGLLLASECLGHHRRATDSTELSLPSSSPEVTEVPSPSIASELTETPLNLSSEATEVPLLSNTTELPETNSTTNPPATGAMCGVKRRRVEVGYPGCNSTYFHYKLAVCAGKCNSYDTVHLLDPYVRAECNCCTPTKSVIRRRGVSFMCNGIPTTRKVYIAYIENCSCARCGSDIAEG